MSHKCGFIYREFPEQAKATERRFVVAGEGVDGVSSTAKGTGFLPGQRQCSGLGHVMAAQPYGCTQTNKLLTLERAWYMASGCADF